MTLVITGGQQRGARPLAAGGASWYKYARGHVLAVDTETEAVEVRLTPDADPPPERPRRGQGQRRIDDDLAELLGQCRLLEG